MKNNWYRLRFICIYSNCKKVVFICLLFTAFQYFCIPPGICNQKVDINCDFLTADMRAEKQVHSQSFQECLQVCEHKKPGVTGDG